MIPRPDRLWAVSAVHGELDKLQNIHDALLERVEPGDHIIYLGNYTGYGSSSRETVDELLTFRRLFLSIPGVKPDDLVYLRGGQEEMWQYLLQIQFAHNPGDLLLWMLGRGMGATLSSYGICQHQGIHAAREGVMSLTKWTAHIREILRDNPGHDIFMTQYKRAAYTNIDGRTPVLFVNAGIDCSKTLEDQGNDLWWSERRDFNLMPRPYGPFEKVVRGYDPYHEGLHVNCVSASLDGGCGFGGSLVCAGMDAAGDFHELIEA